MRRVPNKPATPTHTIRCADDLWQAMLRATADNDTNITEVTIRFWERYVREHPQVDEEL